MGRKQRYLGTNKFLARRISASVCHADWRTFEELREKFHAKPGYVLSRLLLEGAQAGLKIFTEQG